MRKTFILLTLLCVSVMGWAAIDWSSVGFLGSTNAAISMNTYKYAVDTEAGEVGPNSTANIQGRAGGDGFYSTYGGQTVTSCSHDAEISGDQVWVYVSQLTAKDTKITVTLADASTRNFHLWYKDGVEGGESSKPSPELSLNATAKTLEIDASAETFPIVPTKAEGSGAVSYSSNAEGVATVSNTGLITAVGSGTATITVSVAENENFAADSKTITVEVIDWSNTSWLANSNDSYKLHISPAISDTYGGKRIDGSNLWVGFPSDLFTECSIGYTHLGAGVSFPLSNFTSSKSQFTMVCAGTTYTFTVYRKFDGVNLAKGMPSTAGRDASNARQSNDGNKDSRWASGGGAKHYSVYKDMAEDWWTVDLGAFYEISSIKTLYETAAPKNYSFYTSPNNDSWIEIGSYNYTPNVGNTDANYNEYIYSPEKVARYVKIFAREAVQADFAYGISIWEFEVYGQPAENVDVNAPVLASAAVSGTPTTSEIKITVSASDTEDPEISLYRVRESSLKMDRNFTAVDGKLTFGDLLDGTDYSFTITALDAIGNQSNAIVVNASTAQDPANPATMAPEPPARSADDVRAIYSDAYADILMHDFTPERTDWGSVSATRRVKGGNNYLLYDISSGTNITWGSNDGNANAIVAKDGYHAVGTTGLDASGMEYLHVDIWSLVALTNINVKINDAVFTTITHDGNGWQSYDLPMAESAVDFTNIRWLKLDGITSSGTRGKAAVDNYYFWKAASGVKAVVVSSNNGSWGSATAKVAGEDVTSVATGTEVTFAAAAESGYDFAYWQIGETKVYDNPYVVEVDANITAVATFEPSRTPYCAVPVTNAQGHTIYLTINKTENANEFRILFEGSSNTHITNTHGNIQFRLTHVNGEDGEHHFAGNEWTVDAAGYGTIYTTFTAVDFRAITITNTYIPLTTSNSPADEFNFPTTDATIIKWDATCFDGAAPEMEAPTATAIGPKSVRLELQATDNMAALLQYKVNYKPTADEGDGETVYFNGTSGVQITPIISGLTTDIPYTFTVSVSDGTNESATQTCSATPTLVAAPAPPARNSIYVRSIYSDAYTTILDADFSKTSFAPGDITCVEQDIAGNHVLIYDLGESNNAYFAIGGLNPGDIFVAKEEYRGENNTPDVSEMDYLHVDIWSCKATQYAELQINGVRAGSVALSGEGWQQFDLPLATFKVNEENLGRLKNLQHINFVGLRDPNPEEIAIDNVYFYTVPEELSFADDATDNTDVIGTNADKWANVTLNRNIRADGTWYTLCLPFDMSAEKVNEVFGASTIAELTSAEDRGSLIHLNFDYVHAIEAGKAYLIKAGNNLTAGTVIPNVQIKNVAPIVSVAKDGETDLMHFQGTYNKTTLRDSNIRFVADDNYLYSPNSAGGTPMGAFRCYFTIPTGSPASAPGKRARIVMGEQTATGVQNVQSHQVSYTKMLRDGQLLIIREGRMYNAQGMIVSE